MDHRSAATLAQKLDSTSVYVGRYAAGVLITTSLLITLRPQRGALVALLTGLAITAALLVPARVWLDLLKKQPHTEAMAGLPVFLLSILLLTDASSMVALFLSIAYAAIVLGLARFRFEQNRRRLLN